MKDPVKIVKQEHNLLSEAIKAAKGLQKIKENKRYHELLGEFIIFFRNYTEIYHYPKEEQVLYPLLRNRSGNMDKQFWFEISDNHEDFKSLIALLESDYVMYNYFHLRKNMNVYLDSLSEHLAREDKIIFGEINKLLTIQELESVYNQFKEIDEANDKKENLQKKFYKLMLKII